MSGRRQGYSIPASPAAPGAGSGDLISTNNLSDVTDAPTAAENLGVGVTDSPQFAGVNVGHATDTTITRVAAGELAVEGVNIVRAALLSKSADYTLVLADANTTIMHAAADNNARQFTIPANASVAYPIGTMLGFVNGINTLTIAITSDTMTLVGGGTGSRTMAANSTAVAQKMTATTWMISGSAGLT